MDPNMIRPRKCKPCPPPPPPPPSPKREAPPPPPPPHGENVAQACQCDCCNFRGHPSPFSPLAPPPPLPSLGPCHPPSHVRNYWNDDLDRFSRMRRVESLEMGYRMNLRDPFNDFPEDHTPRHCMAGHQRHRPPPMLMGHHHGQPPLMLGHHRGQTPLLLGHHREPPTSYCPPQGDYAYQHGYSGYENPNGCTSM
ncbi:uncharacterized protein LOC132626608 [Lycium barbarum]|uniref:uncharacterized protein LOC132626608 n=1 Tax=Lycium barbarum TaxID=112863 RepID=UPI00293E8F87|nr:uncharacterized protein LOC132626608 [Lycium barbarum]XP_060197522.1 uncharacterized protein LOC132626608 [Lycium barbarum]